MKGREWLKYRYVGGIRAVWHLPLNGSRFPRCKTNGPISGDVVNVIIVDLMPEQDVCKNCAELLMNEITRFKEETVCPNVRTVKKP